MKPDRRSACYQALEKANNQLALLSEPCRTAVVVDTVVGIIGNGGLAYFFELNFPDDPNYGIFADAFRRVGLGDIADRFASLVAAFPFESPHAFPDLRMRFLKDRPIAFENAMTELESLVWSVDTDIVLDWYFDRTERGNHHESAPAAQLRPESGV